MRTKCLARQLKDLPERSFDHDVYEMTESYGTNDISSVALRSMKKEQLLESGRRGGGEKKDVKMKVYATMLLKTKCRKIQRSRFATIL